MNDVAQIAEDDDSGSAASNVGPTSPETNSEIAFLSESEADGRQHVHATEPMERWGLPLDQVFEVLRNRRRRDVLRYLQGKEQVSLSEVAEQIAAWENDKEVGQITSNERKRVYVGLYQCHLPKMDGMGVIAFNKPRGLIERGEHIDAVEQYIHRVEAPEQPSPTGPVVGLSMLGITVLPIAVIVLSQSTLSLGVAAMLALAASVLGVASLRRLGSMGE